MSAQFLKRSEAMFLINHAKWPKMSYKVAAKYMRKSEPCIKRWVNRYFEVGNVDNLPDRWLDQPTTTKKMQIIMRRENANHLSEIFAEVCRPFFGSDKTNWVLHEYNEPIHRNNLWSTWKRQNIVTTMEWPAMSPDANPIENMWSYIKMKL